ncbi:beta-lactamase family protein [Sphingomonas sp. LB-2]|uniref:serine hydrolase domain-containing protein n=1 Tax=Sphingomonas caeni TaxID=2984949 RepID=UPI00222EB994|nr:serine hydrolase domain-containing protein [Sphingomonas caeni]MCW3846138.1 beta-lactamase family protein [Sphingomonas caeni]
MRVVSIRPASGPATGSDGSADLPWWSFGKTILAIAALRLVEMGQLQLDTPIADKPYTLRQLLQHRSGLGNYGRLADYHRAVAAGEPHWPVAELLRRTAGDRLRYAPGTGWLYSNLGYLEIRRLIEQASGLALGAALHDLVLAPAGAQRARIANAPDDLHDVEMGGQIYDPGWVYHGLIVGPLDDATLVLHRLLSGALLSPAMLEAMRTAHPLPEHRSAALTDPGYGLGLMTNRTAAGARIAGHGGSGPGSNVAVFVLERGEGVATGAIWSTDDSPETLEAQIIAMLENPAPELQSPTR